MNKKFIGTFALLFVLAGLGGASHVNAQTQPNDPAFGQPNEGMMRQTFRQGGMGRSMMKPTAFGTVTAINGNSITITSQMGPKSATSTTYTIDATNAKVNKNRTSSTVSAITVGDKIMVMGTTNGTNITATVINDGIMLGKRGDVKDRFENTTANMPAGNGQPVIGGKVASINGNSISITNAGGTTYTIDVTNSTIHKDGSATSTVSNITVGDSIIAQGTINGTTVTASTVIDHGTAPVDNGQTNQAPENQNQGRPGLFGKVGGFFKHLFGF